MNQISEMNQMCWVMLLCHVGFDDEASYHVGCEAWEDVDPYARTCPLYSRLVAATDHQLGYLQVVVDPSLVYAVEL